LVAQHLHAAAVGLHGNVGVALALVDVEQPVEVAQVVEQALAFPEHRLPPFPGCHAAAGEAVAGQTGIHAVIERAQQHEPRVLQDEGIEQRRIDVAHLAVFVGDVFLEVLDGLVLLTLHV